MSYVKEMKDYHHLSEYQIELEVVKRIKEVLGKVKFVDEERVIVKTDSRDQYDILVVIPSGKMIIEVKANVDLKARDINRLIERWNKNNNTNDYGIVAAPYLSLAARKAIMKADMGYLDLTGNTFISTGNIFIHIDDVKKNPFKLSKGSKNVFKRSSYVSGKILRCILNMKNEPWRTTLLAKDISVSASRVHEVKEFLLQEDLIDKDKRGFILKDPKRLIRMWAEEYTKTSGYSIECYSIDKAGITENNLRLLSEEIAFEYALTGFAGGARYSPTVRYNKVHFYVDVESVDEIIQRLELKKVDKGGNVSILIPDDPSFLLYAQKINGDMVVSEVQAYLDLMGLAARGEEMAENILTEVYS
jgi:hypothetical protein